MSPVVIMARRAESGDNAPVRTGKASGYYAAQKAIDIRIP
jgi:hypothetical protein